MFTLQSATKQKLSLFKPQQYLHSNVQLIAPKVTLLGAASNRGFFDHLNHKFEGVNELTLMSMVNGETRAFSAQQPLEFDTEGRMLIFDSLSNNLKRFYGFFSIASSLGGLQLYHSYIPTSSLLALDSLLHYGGLTYFLLFSTMTFRHLAQQRNKINRVYLLQGGQIARLQFNDGKIQDAPLSAISQVAYDNNTTFLKLSVSGEKGKEVEIELNKATVINPPVLFAMTRHQVSSVQM